jgi:hypothetical protein
MCSMGVNSSSGSSSAFRKDSKADSNGRVEKLTLVDLDRLNSIELKDLESETTELILESRRTAKSFKSTDMVTLENNLKLIYTIKESKADSKHVDVSSSSDPDYDKDLPSQLELLNKESDDALELEYKSIEASIINLNKLPNTSKKGTRLNHQKKLLIDKSKQILKIQRERRVTNGEPSIKEGNLKEEDLKEMLNDLNVDDIYKYFYKDLSKIDKTSCVDLLKGLMNKDVKATDSEARLIKLKAELLLLEIDEQDAHVNFRLYPPTPPLP